MGIEITRRNFFQFLAGCVAGIHATPLPWKLTDDIAIWTQNWPWVPVPPVGEFTHVRSVCGLCPGGCGIQVRKVDHRAVKIEGRTDYPVNPGGICPVGMGGLQLLYNESLRFTGPMKRVGPRGSGQFAPISWNDALGALTSRIAELRNRGNPEAIVAIDGNPPDATASVLVERLLRAVGSANHVRIPSAEDLYRVTTRLMHGIEGPMAYDLENADYILSFGTGLLEGWGAPGRTLHAWGLWHGLENRGKVKVVQVESRASNTASKADQWVTARPGTEAALALGLAHVIVKEHLYDEAFVSGYCFGFDDWLSDDGKQHVGFKRMLLNEYAPARVAEITGLPPEAIIALARDFAGARAPLAVCGKGKGALPGGLYEFMAVHSLNALAGNINQPGGVLLQDPLPLSPLPELEPDATARQGLARGRLDQAGRPPYPFTHSLINNLSRAILDSDESPVDTLLVMAANPAYTLPDGGMFRRALGKVPFVVSFSPYRDETAYMADLILPDHTYLEKRDDRVQPPGLQYPLYGLSTPVVDPVYNTRNMGDVILKLAQGVDASVKSAFPWRKYEEVLKARARGLFEAGGGLTAYEGDEPVWVMQKAGPAPAQGAESFDDMWKKIKSGGLWFNPSHTYQGWGGRFKTPTGKFEFFSSQIELAVSEAARGGSVASILERMGLTRRGDEAFMPHYEEPADPGDRSAYPLTLVPYEMINLASGWIPAPPFLYKTLFDTQLLKKDSFAEIHPETAAEYGLKQGDRVRVQSPKGGVQVRVNLFEGAMPGIVYMPMGFGHTAYDEFLKEKGANPNDIIDGGTDPLSGYPVWCRTPVRLVKI